MLAMAALTGTAVAGPPFLTDDPVPVDFRHGELYLAATYSHDRHGDGGILPMVEANYGVVPDVQLHLIATAAYDAADGESHHYGLGDTELGIKYRFLQESDRLPMAGIFPLVELPSGDSGRDLGSGKVQFFLPLWLQKSWGEWTTYGGGGWVSNPAGKDFWRAGWLLQREMTKQLTLGGEVFFESADAQDARDRTAVNFGGFYDFDEHNHLLFSLGRDLLGDSLVFCYLGFQYTF